MPSGTRSRQLQLLKLWWPAAATLVALAVGGGFELADVGLGATVVWGVAIAATTVSLVVEIIRQLVRRQPGIDVIALLAMVGAILLGELLAGAIIALMLTTGRALEAQADDRARRELTALLEAAPRRAHRRDDDGVVEIDVDEVAPGDRLVIRPGETVPVDGIVSDDGAVLDESALTGESRPVERHASDPVASGALNAGSPFEMRARATAANSTYHGLVRLVEQAQAERPPFVRLADRVALWFVPFTLLVAGGAWALSGEPVRALAVLVVATPCPLILATPIAITSGMSRLARRGMIVKGGGALETLARTQTVLLDKTGTVTAGRPRVVDVEPFDGADPDEVVRLAASLEQVSAHVFAPAVVQLARGRGQQLTYPTSVSETAGQGIEGDVGGHRVRLGRTDWTSPGPIPQGAQAVRRRTAVEGNSAVFVDVDGHLVGALLLEDPLRSDAIRTIRGLRDQGVERVVLLTGDRPDIAELIGHAVDVDSVLAERSPADKVAAVEAASERAVTAMVGDGVNDAPALANADLGIAMGARGATASSQAADIVIVVDRFERLSEALAIAQRTRRIAWQSIQLGMGLAAVAMALAAMGYLSPVAGALVQEVIDVIAILNALRALRGPEVSRPRPELAQVSEELRAEHRSLQTGIDRLRSVADGLAADATDTSIEDLHSLHRFLEDELVPHELAEERDAYPLVADVAGDADPTPALRHTHREIVRLTRLLGHAVESTGPELADEDRPELQRLLYGLHAVMMLHQAQEEEAFDLLDAAGEPARA